MAGFRLSTVHKLAQAQEKEERARLAEARAQRHAVRRDCEALQWDMDKGGTSGDLTSTAMSALAAARSNRLVQSFQLDALLAEKEFGVQEAKKQWGAAAQKEAALEKLHQKFLLAQKRREAKDERDQAQEAAQLQWMRQREGR